MARDASSSGRRRTLLRVRSDRRRDEQRLSDRRVGGSSRSFGIGSVGAAGRSRTHRRARRAWWRSRSSSQDVRKPAFCAPCPGDAVTSTRSAYPIVRFADYVSCQDPEVGCGVVPTVPPSAMTAWSPRCMGSVGSWPMRPCDLLQTGTTGVRWTWRGAGRFEGAAVVQVVRDGLEQTSGCCGGAARTRYAVAGDRAF